MTIPSVSLVWAMLLASTASAESMPPALRVEPESVFTHDDVKVLFVIPYDSKEELFLYRTDAEGNPLKLLATLNDAGAQGDARKDDQVFTRRLQFKESKPKTIYFKIFDQAQRPITHQVATLTVTPRPTFVQTLERVWSRIRQN